MSNIYRIGPLEFIHVLDQITNVTRVVEGPQTLILQQHETKTFGPAKQVTIQPRHYVVVTNPVLREDGNVVFDELGQARLRWGEQEVRLSDVSPFPLYPSERLSQSETRLEMVYKNTALHLLCIEDFVDGKVERHIGDQWLFEGPQQYVPNVNVRKVKLIKAIVIKQNQALKLKATNDCYDRFKNKRVAGEEWIVDNVGAYLPGVFEQQMEMIQARVLTDKTALHVRALRSFKDKISGTVRRHGDEWLITNLDTETYIPSVNEQITKTVSVTTLSSRQYCVVVNYFDPETRKNMWARKKQIVGEASFFLHPGEQLENGREDVYVLNEEQGLVMTATKPLLEDIEGKQHDRQPGERWMVQGPLEYIPPIGARVMRTNEAIALGENEGIYVRNIKSGHVYAIIGRTYLLNEDEELYHKELPRQVEQLLATDKGYIIVDRDLADPNFVQRMHTKMGNRDKTKVVKYNVPHNHAVQLYDYREKIDRVIFGPALVLLQPGETIAPISLSGSKPKRSNRVKCLHLRLGPEFSTDQIIAETADHCRLVLELSYNWKFLVSDESNHEENNKLFAVEDFIGDMCKFISSKVRSAISCYRFKDFHEKSAKVIRTSVFGLDENGKVRDEFFFSANNLMITGIDVRGIEPESSATRKALQSSVQMAIEIAAEAEEQKARNAQKMIEQNAKGELDYHRLVDQCEAEKDRKKLMEAQALTKAVQSKGLASASAKSQAETMRIEALERVEKANLESQAHKIEADADLERSKCEHKQELDYLAQKNKLQLQHLAAMNDIDIVKFENICQSIGANTLEAIASAPAELKTKIIDGLGLDQNLLSSNTIPFVDL